MLMQMTTYGITRSLRPLKSFFAPNQISSSPPYPYSAPMQSQLLYFSIFMHGLFGGKRDLWNGGLCTFVKIDILWAKIAGSGNLQGNGHNHCSWIIHRL